MELVKRVPDDGRLLVAWARGLVSSGDATRAEDAFRRGLVARVPAPVGAAWELARLLLASTPARKKEALEVLRQHGPLLDDREALDRWKELEIEMGDEESPEAGRPERQADAAIAAWERRKGRDRLRAAKRYVVSVEKSQIQLGLDAATEAATLLADSADAWRLKGWFEARAKRPEAAAVSLRRAIDLSKEPAADRSRARAYFRLNGLDPAALEGPGP
jgi:tetratricopeptide (TPR) repeat protein